MYLSELKLWNFRKYGVSGNSFDSPEPGLCLQLEQGLNVLIGENDSGKTAIIDAIRYALGTQSGEWIQFEETDFHGQGDSRAPSFKIECVFRGFTHAEAGPFLEWLGFEEVNGKKEYDLHLRLTSQRKPDRIVTDLRAGPDEIGMPMDGEARARLRVTYLKPLRDAENELTAGRRSRFAQILRAHPHFQKTVVDGVPQQHELEKHIAEANEKIRKHFKPDGDGKAGTLLRTLNEYLDNFFVKGDDRSACIKIAGSELVDILKRLELSLEDNRAGLGTLNLLYIAAELLLLQGDSFPGLRLVMIEELEAHLHPQAQLRLIHFLKQKDTSIQYILTTHSTTLGASIDLKKLVICQGNKVFPMGPDFTELEPKNYSFLERFLDVSKANLFFARGVLLVEGDAENLLIPAIAELIDRPLHRYGVSIVNVGSTAFSHYEKVFIRKNGQSMGTRVAVVTDLDVKPLEAHADCGDSEKKIAEIEANKSAQRAKRGLKTGDPNVARFVAPNWTLEYEIALSSFRRSFYRAVLLAQKKQTSKTGEPKKTKKKEVLEKTKTDIASWKAQWSENLRCHERIAWEIYHGVMLKSRISKAVTAQEFVAWLYRYPHKKKLQETITKEPSLRYLIDAICHVTEPLAKMTSDEDNGS